MQLGALKDRLTPGQRWRRGVKIARRQMAGHLPHVMTSIATPPVRRKHRTWKELVRRAFRRGLRKQTPLPVLAASGVAPDDPTDY